MKGFIILFILLIAHPIQAKTSLDGVDLWLPLTYQNHYLSLTEAAKKAQSDQFCKQLLSGRLDESKSTNSHLHFYFRCKAEDKTTFSIEVFGPKLTLENSYGERQQQLIAEQQAKVEQEKREQEKLLAIRQAEDAKALREKQSQYWGICRDALKERLRYFSRVTILSEVPPEPSANELELTYVIDFDAVSPTQKTLHFRITCKIDDLESFSVDVGPRKLVNTH